MKSMKFKNILAALGLAAAGSSGAAVLTFDSLNAVVYGDGTPLLASMSYNGLSLAYQEAGFLFTLHTPNAAPGAAHISDGTGLPQTFNWHDGMENGAGTYVTLTRAGGGLFNLLGFDYYTDGSAVSADGQLAGLVAGEGSWSTALNGISELRLSSGAFNEIDNVNVEAAASAVPLPGSLALMLGGLVAGAAARRRKR